MTLTPHAHLSTSSASPITLMEHKDGGMMPPPLAVPMDVDEKHEMKHRHIETIDPEPVKRVRTLYPLYLHQWLDVLDTKNVWMEGQIVNIDSIAGKVLIHYKGWNVKYDEWFSSDPNHPDAARLALLHTHTRRPYQPCEMKCRIDTKLDVMDTTDKWLPATVVDIDPLHDQVYIRYDGWDAKYNEWIDADSYRLARLYTHTPPPLVAPPSIHPVSSHRRPPPKKTPTVDNETNFRLLLARELQYTIVDMAGDGNCLFRSVSHQVYGTPDHHAIIRDRCIRYIELERHFFASFISESFEEYVMRMKKDGEWGDHVEIQAMSEIYNRPIEVYAYNTSPMKTYLSGSPNPPIRLSYHFQSHYNSIVHEPTHSMTICHEEVGVVEDEALRRSASRTGVQRTDSLTAELEQLQLALQASRAAFEQNDMSAFDLAVQSSLADFTSAYDGRLEAAKSQSLTEYQDRVMLDQVIKQSEQEMIEKQLLSAVGATETLPTPDIEQQLLKQAMDESLQSISSTTTATTSTSATSASTSTATSSHDDELKRALAASLSASTSLPSPVQHCHDLGFDLDRCYAAYSIYSQLGGSNTEITQAMTEYLCNTGFS